TEVRYMAMAASPQPETIEKVFRWHMFSWALSNLAAISYSDLVLDIEKLHDDKNYRAYVANNLARIGVTAEFGDLKKFDRYYKFEFLDPGLIWTQVASTITAALRDGRLGQALRGLGKQPPITPVANAVELLLEKMDHSIASMTAHVDSHHINAAQWKAIAN